MIIAGFVTAVLSGRSGTSGIYRFIRNRIEWLREVTGYPDAEAVSRAHLPRFLQRLKWTELNDIIEQHFGTRMKCDENKEWTAVDGKTLRGTVKGGDKQAVLPAVTHEGREVVAQAPQPGSKSSEINAVRTLLKDSGLERRKVTLDAHHCNPKTTAQISQAGGQYLIQVKENQPVLLEQCRDLAAGGEPLGENIDHDKCNGRITTRHTAVFDMSSLDLDSRWAESSLQTLVTVTRETFNVSKGRSTVETSCYVSNRQSDISTGEQTAEKMARAVRGHWGVEADNYIRDKTFKEDDVKTRNGNQAQIMGRLRSLAMELIRKTGTKNFQETIEKFIDCPAALLSCLKQTNFL